MTAIAGAGARSIAVLANLITVPLTLHYLGRERYGLWIAITSLLLFLNFSDLGLSTGLINAVAEANGKDDRQRAREYVSSCFWMLVAISAIIVFVWAVVYPFVDWVRTYNLSDPQAIKEAGPATTQFLLCAAVALPLGVIARIQSGYQEGYTPNIYQAIGSALSLVAIVIAIKQQADLVVLVLAAAGVQQLPNLINTLYSFSTRYRDLLPRWSSVRWDAVKHLYRIGSSIFLLQVGYGLAYNIDSILIARVLGPAHVAEYSVVTRLFSVATVAVALFAVPLYAAYGEALARADYQWIRATLKASVAAALLLAGLPAIVLIFLGPSIIRWWVGNVPVSLLLIVAVAAWVTFDSLRIMLVTYFSGTYQFRFQIILFAIFVPVSVAVRILAAKYSGLEGMVWANVVCFVVLLLIPYGYRARKSARDVVSGTQPIGDSTTPELA